MRGMGEEGGCPVMHGAHSTSNTGMKNVDWWPNQLNVNILHQNDKKSKQGQFKNGFRVGKWTQYSQKGWIEQVATYKNGKEVSLVEY